MNASWDVSSLYGDGLHGDDLYGDGLHGDDLYGDGLHGDDLYGDDLHGDDLHGDDLHGDDLHGDGGGYWGRGTKNDAARSVVLVDLWRAKAVAPRATGYLCPVNP